MHDIQLGFSQLLWIFDYTPELRILFDSSLLKATHPVLLRIQIPIVPTVPKIEVVIILACFWLAFCQPI